MVVLISAKAKELQKKNLCVCVGVSWLSAAALESMWEANSHMAPRPAPAEPPPPTKVPITTLTLNKQCSSTLHHSTQEPLLHCYANTSWKQMWNLWSFCVVRDAFSELILVNSLQEFFISKWQKKSIKINKQNCWVFYIQAIVFIKFPVM